METDNLQGLGVALVTPFDPQGNIDIEALEKLLTHLNEVDYLVAFGTTGESATLSAEEKSGTLQFIKKLWDKPLVLGYGGNNTAALIEGIDDFEWEGVTAVLSVSPYYNKPSQSGIIKHYEKLADHLPVPVILYNVPGRTGSKLSTDTTVHLSQHPNIIGTKEASGDLEQIEDIVRETSGFLMISGDDLLTPDILKVGGVGLISVLANAYPDDFKRAIDLFRNGDETESRDIFRKFEALNNLMYKEGSPTGIKELLSQLQLCGNTVRLPMDSASAGLREEISHAKI